MARSKRNKAGARALLDQIRYGQYGAQVRHTVGAREFHKLGVRAHKLGFTVGSFVDPTIPNAMKERTPSAIKKQAMDLVTSQYAPAEKDILDRKSQLGALEDRRKADAVYYTNWMNGMAGKMNDGITQANQALMQSLTQGAQASNARWSQAGQSLPQGSTAAAGVSNAGAAAGVVNTANLQAAAQALAGQNQQQGSKGGMLGAYLASIFANQGATNAQRLSDLGTEGAKLALQKGADISKTTLDLQQNEQTKAGSNRDYGALLSKLDLQGQQVQLDQYKARTSAKDKAAQRRENKRWHDMQNKVDAQANSIRANKNSADSAHKEAEFMAKYGKSTGQWAKMTPEQRRDWLKGYNKSTKAGSGSKGGKKTGSQANYNEAFSKLASSSIKGKPITQEYARLNYNAMIRQLVAAGYDYRVAEAAVFAYVDPRNTTGSPGSYRHWRVRVKQATPKR